MKKILFAILFATGLIASSNTNYFGVYGGNARLSTSASTKNVSTNGGQITFALGHYYGNTSRVTASYTYINHDASVNNSDIFSLAYDFILPVPVAQHRFSLYAGPSIGYTRYDGNNYNFDGFDYGGEAGVIVHVVSRIELEAGYRYLVETGRDTSSGIKLNRMQMWYIGANLRF